MPSPELENELETESAEMLGRLLKRAADQVDKAIGPGTASAHPDVVQKAASDMLKALIVKHVDLLEVRHVQALADFNASLLRMELVGLDVETAQSIASGYVAPQIKESERLYRDALSEVLRKTADIFRPAAKGAY